ncbi:MAG: dienelactone hydrolase family protein [Gemmatimonadaceae bacterium]
MIERQIDIATKDGTVDAELFRPDSTERFPGVIVLTDIHGLRPGVTDFSRRIAEHGYIVLTPNIFYRTTRAPVFDFEADFRNERTQARFKELVGPLTPDAMARDASAYVDFLSSQEKVGSGPMGVVGFCFSGAFALRTAAARPDQIAAAASFHGARLVMDTPESPHLVLPKVKAQLYFGHAENDQSMPAEMIEKFDRALEEWGGTYESEVYSAKHGWMFPGKVYDAEQADRGFEKLMELFDSALRTPVNA